MQFLVWPKPKRWGELCGLRFSLCRGLWGGRRLSLNVSIFWQDIIFEHIQPIFWKFLPIKRKFVGVQSYLLFLRIPLIYFSLEIFKIILCMIYIVIVSILESHKILAGYVGIANSFAHLQISALLVRISKNQAKYVQI